MLNDAAPYLIKLNVALHFRQERAEHQAGYEDRDKSHGMP
jgi:hypothetical protein